MPPQSAQCSSVLQSAPICNPSCRTCKIASGVRACNCACPRGPQHVHSAKWFALMPNPPTTAGLKR
eukprot:4130980-Alexandrium_andersonii.AAC.1